MEAINTTWGIAVLDSMFDGNKVNFISLDNLLDEVGADKHVLQLFTKRQDDNLSVIYLTQNSFYLSLCFWFALQDFFAIFLYLINARIECVFCCCFSDSTPFSTTIFRKFDLKEYMNRTVLRKFYNNKTK